MSFAVPGQQSRPDLDTVMLDLEDRCQRDRCEVCGREGHGLRYQLVALWDGETSTPLMCPECLKNHESKEGDKGQHGG